MNLPSYTSTLAALGADAQLEVSLILADGQVSPEEFPRLVAALAVLPILVNGLDWIDASRALAIQQLRRGPDAVTPDPRLAARLADLAAVRGAENAPACSEQTGAPTPATHPLPEGTEAL